MEGGRSHGCTHIHGVFNAHIHHTPGSDSGDGCDSFFSVLGEYNRTAAGDGPRGGKRPLVSISQRETELLFSRCKMAGSHSHNFIRVAPCHGHSPQIESFSHGGTGSK